MLGGWRKYISLGGGGAERRLVSSYSGLMTGAIPISSDVAAASAAAVTIAAAWACGVAATTFGVLPDAWQSLPLPASVWLKLAGGTRLAATEQVD